MKEEALAHFYSKQEIDLNLKFYGVLDMIERKLTLTRDSVDTNADFDYLMAYQDKIEKLIKREPWKKRAIQNNFYADYLTYGSGWSDIGNIEDDILFYLNDIVRYSIYFGSKKIENIIEKVLTIQADANEDFSWDVIYSEDLLGERFSV